MGYCEFSHYGNKSVIVKFVCDKCESEVSSEEISIPPPDYTAEKPRDSHGENWGYGICEKCNKEFNISVFAGFSDAYVDVDDVADEDVSVEEIVDERELDFYISQQIESIVENEDYINQFKKEIDNLRQLNELEIQKTALQETLQRQLYSGAITCLEDYLSTTLIQKIFNDENYFRKFVKTYSNIKNRKFELSTLYDKLDEIRDIVKKELAEVIYHDLPKVKNMYINTFEIKFPLIKDLMKIIANRHDMVHRNGKTKDGEKIEISKEVVTDVIDKVNNFVKDIEKKIYDLENPLPF